MMVRRGLNNLLVASCALTALVSCSPEASKVASLEKELSAQRKEIEDLRTEISDLRMSVLENGALLGITRDRFADSVATLDVGSEGYSVVRNQFGAFIVTVQSATAYLDGYKLVLAIGNPTFVTFNGLDVELYWTGACRAKEGATSEKCENKHKKYSMTDAIKPGVYSEVEVFLPNATVDDLKLVTIQMDFNRLRLGVQ